MDLESLKAVAAAEALGAQLWVSSDSLRSFKLKKGIYFYLNHD